MPLFFVLTKSAGARTLSTATCTSRCFSEAAFVFYSPQALSLMKMILKFRMHTGGFASRQKLFSTYLNDCHHYFPTHTFSNDYSTYRIVVRDLSSELTRLIQSQTGSRLPAIDCQLTIRISFWSKIFSGGVGILITKLFHELVYVMFVRLVQGQSFLPSCAREPQRICSDRQRPGSCQRYPVLQ